MRECTRRFILFPLFLSFMLLGCFTVNAEVADKSSRCGGLVNIGEPIVVKEKDVVEGDVVCIGADIEIYGVIKGDAVSVGGALVLKSTAVVYGDAVSIGGKIKKHENAKIHGESVSVDVLFTIERGHDARFYI